MNAIISRIENILAADGWKRTTMLQVFLDELKEKRDAALKSKALFEEKSLTGVETDAQESQEIESAVPSKEEDTTTMLKDAQEAVREFNRAVVDVKTA